MAEFPYLPVSVAPLVADTQHLNAQEFGAYCSLLFNSWLTRECALPTDDKKLARLARCSLREWLRIKQVVMAFWQPMDDGLWHQKKLDEVRATVTGKKHKASESAQARWLKEKERRDADALRRQCFGDANQKQKQIIIPVTSSRPVAEVAALAPGGARLPDSAKWAARLEAYRPWEGVHDWPHDAGPKPDSAATPKVIPQPQLEAWQGRAKIGWAEARAQEKAA